MPHPSHGDAGRAEQVPAAAPPAHVRQAARARAAPRVPLPIAHVLDVPVGAGGRESRRQRCASAPARHNSPSRFILSCHACQFSRQSAPGSRGCARTTGDSAHDSSTGAASHGVPLFVGTSERTDRGDAERQGPAATDARGGPRAASVSHESPRPVLPWQTPVETRQRVESTWQGSCNF